MKLHRTSYTPFRTVPQYHLSPHSNLNTPRVVPTVSMAFHSFRSISCIFLRYLLYVIHLPCNGTGSPPASPCMKNHRRYARHSRGGELTIITTLYHNVSKHDENICTYFFTIVQNVHFLLQTADFALGVGRPPTVFRHVLAVIRRVRFPVTKHGDLRFEVHRCRSISANAL